jgi:hypothetical protein
MTSWAKVPAISAALRVSTNCGLKYKETPSVAMVAIELRAQAEQQRSEEGVIQQQRGPRLLDADHTREWLCDLKHKLAVMYP